MGEIFTAVGDSKGKEEIIHMEIGDLREFRGHTFQVRDDEEMKKLTESIGECGILNPILAFSNEDGEPEIISGHRRVYAARKLGFTTVPVIMKRVTRDEATFLMGVSNFTNRETILPSEKAFTFKAMMEAIRTRERSTGEGHEKEERTRTILSKQTGVGSSQIQRLLRLTELTQELLELVDRKELALRPAVELSYLDQDVQRSVYEICREEGVFPTTAVIRELRSLQEKEQLTEAELKRMLSGRGERTKAVPDTLVIHSRHNRLCDVCVEIKESISQVRFYSPDVYEIWENEVEAAARNGSKPPTLDEVRERYTRKAIMNPAKDYDLGWNALGIQPPFLGGGAAYSSDTPVAYPKETMTEPEVVSGGEEHAYGSDKWQPVDAVDPPVVPVPQMGYTPTASEPISALDYAEKSVLSPPRKEGEY